MVIIAVELQWQNPGRSILQNVERHNFSSLPLYSTDIEVVIPLWCEVFITLLILVFTIIQDRVVIFLKTYK